MWNGMLMMESGIKDATRHSHCHQRRRGGGTTTKMPLSHHGLGAYIDK